MELNKARPFKRVFFDARRALGMDQGDLAEAMRVSRRTIIRWQHGQTAPVEAQVRELAALVHEEDADLADELLASAMLAPTPAPEDTRAESLAVSHPASATPAKPPSPHGRAPAHLVDAIVYAAADAADMVPRAMRSALRAAFSRAVQLGVSIESIVLALDDEKDR
jgi:transcriptional regulator with XRE-family HTH domain